MARLIRTLRVGMAGDDVYAMKRTVHRYLRNGLLDDLERQPLRVRQTFGVFFRAHVKNAQHKARVDETGVITPAFAKVLIDADAADAFAVHLLERYEIAHARPIVQLVQPRQGWGSLHQSLWEVFSIGRHRGFADLGTWNPRSLLPSGRPSDHAVYPAYAFDLGFSPAHGFDHQAARDYFFEAVKRPEVEYVILGNRIWTRAQGLHTYTAGGHADHIHVSGNR